MVFIDSKSFDYWAPIPKSLVTICATDIRIYRIATICVYTEKLCIIF